MPKYIILENFKMDKYIYDDKNSLWYELLLFTANRSQI